MVTSEESCRSSAAGFRWEGGSHLQGFSTGQCLQPPLPPPGGNNTSWPPQIRSVSDSAFMVPNGSNKMQEAFCQMSLSSDITGESGNGICLHSRNSSLQGQGEAEMARGAESNLGLLNEQERLLRSNLSSGSKHTVWHALVLLTRLDSLLSCLNHEVEGEKLGKRVPLPRRASQKRRD